MNHYKNSGVWIFGILMFVVLAVGMISITRNNVLLKNDVTGFAASNTNPTNTNPTYTEINDIVAGAPIGEVGSTLLSRYGITRATRNGNTYDITYSDGRTAVVSNTASPSTTPGLANGAAVACTSCSCTN